MIAIIPAAGEGKRLAEIQPGVPKALKKIGGKPMILYALDKLFFMKMKPARIYVVVNPRDTEIFKKTLHRDYVYWNVDICEQPMARGTGDAISHALESIPFAYESPLLIMYPDVLVDLKIENFISQGNAVMTKPRTGSGSCVYRCPSDPDRIVSVSEKPRKGMGNVGEKLGDWCFFTNAMYLYIACKCLAGLTWEGYEGVHKPEKTNQEFSLTQAVDALIRCGMHFRGVHVKDYYGMGNPEAFAKAEEYLSNVQK